jgi:Xaa-Pro aminopeptidase
MAQLASLRRLLQKHSLFCYIIPSEDAHFSEYLSDCDKRRAFISGFTGSRGSCIVTQTQALLWTDGRYFLQASKELSPDWTLMKEMVAGIPTMEEWLEKNCQGTVGVDPTLVSCSYMNEISQRIASGGHTVAYIYENLVDAVWGQERPGRPSEPLFVLDVQYTGQTAKDKLAMVSSFLQDNQADALVVADLCDVAYLLNLRGNDIPYTPVFFAYLFLSAGTEKNKGKDKNVLFTDKAKITPAVNDYLTALTIEVQPYDSLPAFLMAVEPTVKVMVDATACSVGIWHAVPEVSRMSGSYPMAGWKAIKNETEIENLRRCHLRDSVALCRWMRWLKEQEPRALSEFAVAESIFKFRQEQPHFISNSFETIAAFGPHAAIVHYGEHAQDAYQDGSVILLDSGGQYLDGTTDVTRTVWPGSSAPAPSVQVQSYYTAVLEAHLALMYAKVKASMATGSLLDSIARVEMWKREMDFNHGTGHGVGFCLGVHESPPALSVRLRAAALQPVQSGMVFSNEPGVYVEGICGVRLEGVQIARCESGSEWMTFEHLTWVPFDLSLVAVDMLSARSLELLNEYHAEVRTRLMPLIQEDASLQEWLLLATQPVTASV